MITLDTPIDKLGIGTRTFNALMKDVDYWAPDHTGVVTLRDLANAKESTLLRCPNFGRKSLSEVRYLVSVAKGEPIAGEFQNPMIADKIKSLTIREHICWNMAEVFLHARDAHGLHDMGVEIQGIQWALRELKAVHDGK